MCQLCTPRPASLEDRNSNTVEDAARWERDAALYDDQPTAGEL